MIRTTQLAVSAALSLLTALTVIELGTGLSVFHTSEQVPFLGPRSTAYYLLLGVAYFCGLKLVAQLIRKRAGRGVSSLKKGGFLQCVLAVLTLACYQIDGVELTPPVATLLQFNILMISAFAVCWAVGVSAEPTQT